jgi:hypothetical protein
MPDLCPPLVAYILFLSGLVVYNMYMRRKPSVVTTFLYLVFGSVLMWILCAAGLSSVGWAVLAVPVIFYLFLFAILVFENGFLFSREENTCEEETHESEHEECDAE